MICLKQKRMTRISAKTDRHSTHSFPEGAPRLIGLTAKNVMQTRKHSPCLVSYKELPENDKKAGAFMKKVKQIWCVCIAAVWCLTLCGCDLNTLVELQLPTTTTIATTTTTTLPSVDVPMTLLENGRAYDQLGEMQRANYEAVVKELYEKRGQDTMVEDEYGLSVTLPHAMRSEEEIKQLYNAVCDDHPEFFYLTPQYGWTSIGKFYPTLRFYYIWNAEERAAKATELEAAVSSLVTQAQGMTAVEQELFFHDTLIERCEYNQEAANSEDALDRAHAVASSSYAALCSGDPICGGYSRAFQLLLGRVGIVSTPIINEDHMWTMVWLGDAAYHVDVTWDDPVEGKEQHSYFNITDEEIRATREYPTQSRLVSKATATEYNYYVMNGWYFTDAFDESLDDCIREQITSGKEMIELKFAPDAFIDAGSWLFDDEAFFDAVYELEDDTLRDEWYSEVFYEENEELGVIGIYPGE